MCLTKKGGKSGSNYSFKKPFKQPVRFSKSARKLNVERIAHDPKFLIIGAGAAGIACATQLIKDGFREVSIIEASNRIGGRILTVPFADNVVDLGAQWCHGQVDNVVYQLVKDRDLLETTGNIYVTFECIRSNGEIVPQSTVQKLKDLLSDIFIDRHKDLNQFHDSFGAYLTMKFFERLASSEYDNIDKRIAREFFENFKRMESSESAAGVDQISGRGFNNYKECEGDYLLNWRDKGYAQFLRVLTNADIIENEHGVLEDRILFKSPVEKIIWDREDAKVEVVCEGMKKGLVADHVIVTVSLGVLRACADKMFVPKLPESKMRAINGIGFGEVGKIFIEFPEQFWPIDWTGFALLWREEDYKELRATDNVWLEDIYGFYCVNYQPRLLVAWIVGANVQLMEQMEKKKVLDGCMYLLRRFLKFWTIPEPVDLVTTKWSTNKLYRGAYSFWAMKTDELRTSPTELAQPLTTWTDAPAYIGDDGNSIDSDGPLAMKPLVMFAGEATSSHYYSTVHGAVESGWREASRLAGYYGLDL